MLWDHDWAYALALAKEQELNLCDLQLANCHRMDRHDAVYIFDEVGSGKTITAGLMALHYLWHYNDDRNRNVLVLTTHALTQGENGGQFLNDWYSKLPFAALQLEGRITVVDHHCSNIKKADPSQYGLVIIDEVQEFLDKNIERSKALANAYKENKNSLTEKVVFLTATPIKGAMRDSCPDREAGWENLNRYREIAEIMLAPYHGKLREKTDWPDVLLKKSQSSEAEDLICAGFDLDLPVTRYFKDTVHNLTLDGAESKSPKRELPELWHWNQTDPEQKKEFVLLKRMRDIMEKKEPLSRFLVFVRYVSENEIAPGESAKHLLDYLTKGDQELEGFPGEVAAVTGEWRSDGFSGTDLSMYSCPQNPDSLPRVLILTYQIAEAGVNLPGFNYVVNYHISRFPSALEQRFGRIDRKDSAYRQIHISYLLDESEKWDINTNNFHRAVNTALDGVIPLLPSRNAMLSADILLEHMKVREQEKRRIEKMEQLLRQDTAYEAYQIYQKPAGSRGNIEDETFKSLIGFFDELDEKAQRAQNEDEDDKDSFVKLKKEIGSKDDFFRQAAHVIKNVWKRWAEAFSSGVNPEQIVPIIEQYGNDIFYMSADGEKQPRQDFNASSLKSISLEKCRELTRASLEKGRRYLYPEASDICEFRDGGVEPWNETFRKHKEKMNQYFCDQFRRNNLREVFPDVCDLSFVHAHRETVGFYRERIVRRMIGSYAPPDVNIRYMLQGIRDVEKDIVQTVRKGNSNDPWKLDAYCDILTLNTLLGSWRGAAGYCFLDSVYQLPLFQMCRDFERSLHRHLHTEAGEQRLNYSGDPVALACYDVREQAAALGLMPREIGIEDIKRDYLTIEISNPWITASSWYQLAAKYFMEHPELDMRSYFYSNWDWEKRFGDGNRTKLRRRGSVKWPWPDGVDISSLWSTDCFTQHFIDACCPSETGR